MRAHVSAVGLLVLGTLLAGCQGGQNSSGGSCLPGVVPANSAVIYGHVSAQGGGALAGATVSVQLPGGQRVQDATDAAGCYVLAVIAGAYAVTCEMAGYAKQTASSGVLSVGASVQVDFTLSRA